MRLDPSVRPVTNGSSQNGSSPHTNGSAKSETNGFHTNGHVVPKNTSPFYGHDREEVTRILLQSLLDLGYQGAAAQLSRESGCELEIPSVARFRTAVQEGDWDNAESLLFGSQEEDNGVPLDVSSNGHGPSRNESTSNRGSNGHFVGLPLAESADKTQLLFYIRQQKYLELLEGRKLGEALGVLRNELTPLKRDIGRLHALSSLMMCQIAEDVRAQAQWDGAEGESRRQLLSEISKSISPSVMIPEHRLATLFGEVQQEQVLNCRYHNTTAQPSLYTDHACAAEDFPMQAFQDLRNHSDEVWHLEFSHDGTMLATAGKDGVVFVYRTDHTDRWTLLHELREHDRSIGPDNNGITYVAFSPDDKYLISCSQNTELVVVNLQTGQRAFQATHFEYPVTTAAWLPDSQTFVVGTQTSRRPLGLYSLFSMASSSSVIRNNEIYSWRDPPWDQNLKDNPVSFRTTDCAVTRDGSRMVAATIDNKIMMYDLLSRNKIREWQMEEKLTSINFNADGSLMLVNMNEGRVLALDSDTGQVVCRYEGAQQKEYVIRSCFGGAGENFVMSGSEGKPNNHVPLQTSTNSTTDSRIYIWRRQTGVQVAALEAHGTGTVNAVAWHPTNPSMFASAGDDRRVRIWSSAAAVHALPTEAGASRTSGMFHGR